MSFSTLNGVNAARTGGLAGTRRAALPQTQQNMGGNQPMPTNMPASMGGQQVRPETPLASAQATPAARYGLGGTAAAFADTAQGMSGEFGGGGGSSETSYAPGFAPGKSRAGVKVGYNQQAPLQGPAPVQFDPNDPENAALAGYMHGA